MADSPDFQPAGDAGTLKARSASGAMVTLAAQAIKFVLQFGSQIALARLLLPVDFGLVAMVAPIIAGAMLLTDLGLSQATVQRPTISQVELSSLFWFNLLIGGILATATAIAAPLLASFYDTPALTWIIVTMSASLLLSSLTAQHLAILNRRMEFGAIAAIEVGSLVASVAIGVTAALLGCGAWSLVAMQIANGLVALAIAWSFSRWRPSRPRIDREAIHLIRFGGAVTGYNLLGYLITNLDNILIGARFGAGPLGLYDRAYKLMFQPLWQMTAPAARVAVPLLSRLEAEPADYRSAYMTMLGMVLILTTPGLLCAMIFAAPVIEVLLGARWLAAAPIFAWLGACALTLQLRQAASWLFVSQGRAREQLKWGGLGSLSIVAAYLVGIGWGPLGVAIGAAVASAFVQIPLMWWAVTRSGPVSARDALGILAPIGLAALVSGGALALLRPLIAWNSFPALLLALGLAYALFLLGLTPFAAGRRLIGQAGGIVRKRRRG
jgi:PST family polysaccharide transporter